MEELGFEKCRDAERVWHTCHVVYETLFNEFGFNADDLREYVSLFSDYENGEES
jgi:hypothetical protein